MNTASINQSTKLSISMQQWLSFLVVVRLMPRLIICCRWSSSLKLCYCIIISTNNSFTQQKFYKTICPPFKNVKKPCDNRQQALVNISDQSHQLEKRLDLSM